MLADQFTAAVEAAKNIATVMAWRRRRSSEAWRSGDRGSRLEALGGRRAGFEGDALRRARKCCSTALERLAEGSSFGVVKLTLGMGAPEQPGEMVERSRPGEDRRLVHDGRAGGPDGHRSPMPARRNLQPAHRRDCRARGLLPDRCEERAAAGPPARACARQGKAHSGPKEPDQHHLDRLERVARLAEVGGRGQKSDHHG